ncbi:cytochrome P450 [Streptacidiphilus fuscans]|uniref:Cytochrome P450 n=1 Tax=Streptacidiphilus fuscans TaxID=2789292 RepID=A0A931AX90_9ACTN|nr:cytochrome P450 [Streptacidiphilus fuscans]MBF9067195.1 cytochrome P450 [Streptacidiphilus fuscans]
MTDALHTTRSSDSADGIADGPKDNAVSARPVPAAPGRLPLIGHTWTLWKAARQGGLYPYLTGLADAGPLLRLDIPTAPMVVVTDPDLAWQVMVAQGGAFEKGMLYTKMAPLVGSGLATADGPTHRRHRRMVQPAFHRSAIAGYARTMSEHALAMADSWQPGQILDVDQATAALAVDTLAATLFDADIGRAAADVVRADVPVILRHMLVRAALPRAMDRLPLTAHREFDAATARLRAVIDQVVSAARADSRPPGLDLLSLLMAARDEDTAEGFTDSEIRDELMTILFAGSDTSGSTLAWALHELAAHPEAEERLHAEVDEVVGRGGAVTAADVPRLEQTRRIVEETLRLHSVTMLMRRTLRPVTLGGHLLPAGTEVAYSLYALMRHRRHFPGPDRFDPERWGEARRREIPREAQLAFGAGARKCIGDTFAMTEMTIALATVAARWRLRPAPGPEPRPVMAAMPLPDRVRMRVEAR